MRGILVAVAVLVAGPGLANELTVTPEKFAGLCDLAKDVVQANKELLEGMQTVVGVHRSHAEIASNVAESESTAFVAQKYLHFAIAITSDIENAAFRQEGFDRQVRAFCQ